MSTPADADLTVRRSVVVNTSPERAFRVFTEKFGSWWPAGHHIGEAELADVVVEPFVGGRWFERGTDGSECDWGRVLAHEPPHRLLLSWHLQADWAPDSDPARASEIEVRFAAEADGRTRVDLEHRALHRHGDGAASISEAISQESGWTGILASYVAAVGAP